MGIFLFLLVSLLLLSFPVLRTAVFHPFKSGYYAVKDLYHYIRGHKWKECRTGELVAYVGLFGRGKTLSAVHKVVSMYKKYNGKRIYDYKLKKWITQRVVVISNVALSIPYQDFVSMQQIVDAAERRADYDGEHDTRTITLVLGDEFSVQMNSREFKKNLNPLLLNTILTCRHHYISLYYTAQRFQHVDALLRQVTSYVVDCDKLWRFQKNYKYSAWEMENATNALLLRPISRGCWFVRDADYQNYNTLACVGNLVKSWDANDMLSEEEILALQCNNDIGMDGVVKPSRKFVKAQRKRRK